MEVYVLVSFIAIVGLAISLYKKHKELSLERKVSKSLSAVLADKSIELMVARKTIDAAVDSLERINGDMDDLQEIVNEIERQVVEKTTKKTTKKKEVKKVTKKA